jgi:hypothetical protein
VNVDNYGLTLVDFKNVGRQDDPWVLADRVAHVFYVLDLETVKYVIVFRKQKNVGVKNVEDNDDDVNQFKDMPLFTNLMNIKHREKVLTRMLPSICEKVAKENLHDLVI